MKPYDAAFKRLPKKPRRVTVADILDMQPVQEVDNSPRVRRRSEKDAGLDDFLLGINKTPKTNPEGFSLALAFFARRIGRVHGAKTAMANEIGVSRAVVDSWDGVGIPRRHLAKVSEKTGIRIDVLKPDPTK